MVEGPGCKIKGETMRKRIIGKIVQDVFVPLQAKNNQAVKEVKPSHHQFSVLHGLQISEIRTLGKELFIFFTNCSVCVRIHFLMDGSVRYGNIHGPSSSDPSLVISFSDDKLSLFKSAISLRPSEDALKHYNFLSDLDICSPSFNFNRALELVEGKQSQLICDVIMDQDILPGVGNIIKNEGLFKSGINPNTLVSDLSSSLVSCLIHRLRDFSAVFYMCRKRNNPLAHHLCIYEKKKCTQCGENVTVCKPGNLKRLTFYCNMCQVNSSKSTLLSLPKKNSVLSYLQKNYESSYQDNGWECPTCTYINRPPLQFCEICSTQISNCKKRKLAEHTSLVENVNKRPKLDLHSDKGGPENRNDSITPTQKAHINTKSTDVKSVPMCTGHAKEGLLRTVTRAGENKGRLFYCCSLRGGKQCKFFQWADLHHPLCTHGKRTILRRVLKQNDNNSKEFFCCPFPKGKQCDFFQWVEGS